MRRATCCSLKGRHPSPEAAAISAGVDVAPQGTALTMAGGTALPLWHWAPPAGTATRAVIIGACTGFNDYRCAFVLPTPWWTARGIEIYAYDHSAASARLCAPASGRSPAPAP